MTNYRSIPLCSTANSNEPFGNVNKGLRGFDIAVVAAKQIKDDLSILPGTIKGQQMLQMIEYI